MYYVSRALQAGETNYTKIEKLVYALVMTANETQIILLDAPYYCPYESTTKKITCKDRLSRVNDLMKHQT